MLTLSNPVANATLSNATFEVSGTCSSDHQITVTLTMSASGQFHNYYTQAVQGGWSTTVSPWGDGAYQVKVICQGLNDSIAVDLTVGTPQAMPGP